MELALSSNNHYEKAFHAKRVDIVSIRMVKEASFLYKNRKVVSPDDAYNLIKGFFECMDREELIVCSLDTKNQPTTINVVSIGTLNSSRYGNLGWWTIIKLEV
ncbi:JAB domain-containing protein [Clostridium sp. DJ247]|nr:JAB domain-containing protein [Clostridium sp. DJ247]